MVLEYILRCLENKSPILRQLGLKEAAAVGAWYIWWQRREIAKGEQVAPAGRTTFAIEAITKNFQVAASNARPNEISWEKPTRDSYKLNADACFFQNGWGAATSVLNDRGEALAGSTWIFDHVLDATMAEAIETLREMEILENLGCSPRTFESDCLKLIQSCMGIIKNLSPYIAVVAEIFMVAGINGSTSFKHCPWEAN